MPLITKNPPTWPKSKLELCELGMDRITEFCVLNQIECPTVYIINQISWGFDACAFYRYGSVPQDLIRYGYGGGINICLEYCQIPCPIEECRNWTWPGSVIDREPYGVIAHELGHHADYLGSGQRQSGYFGEYSRNVRKESKELKLTNYCPNDAEWFAEMFRLFITNPALLKELRPRTYEIITRKWRPLGPDKDWRKQLGTNVPPRVVRSLINKGADANINMGADANTNIGATNDNRPS